MEFFADYGFREWVMYAFFILPLVYLYNNREV